MLKLNVPLVILLSVALLGVVTLAHRAYRGRAQNYPDAERPGFEGYYSTGEVDPDGAITIASYNIRYGLKIPEAIRDIQRHAPLQRADILLLQEMDEMGTEQLAAQLGYNYIYYPSAIHPRSGRNFGNAILSKWPIIETEKLVLPHESWWSGILRTATKASLEIDQQTVVVYSIHTEYFLSSQQQREDQVRAILEDIDFGSDFVVVGGDFNTFANNGIESYDAQMAGYGLSRLDQGGSPTISKFGVGAITDHIYVRGFAFLDAGTGTGREGSDHYPIWVRVEG